MNLLSGFHRHHIIPRYQGGTDAPENLVLLHPIDHAIAHLVRFKMYGNPADGWAYNRVLNGLRDELIPNRKGIPKPYLRKPKSPETRAKISAATKGRVQPREAVEKTRKALMGRKANETQLACLALGRSRPEGYVSPMKGKTRSTPWLIGLKPVNAGVPVPQEIRDKISQSLKGRKQSPEQVAKRVAARRATLQAQGRTV